MSASLQSLPNVLISSTPQNEQEVQKLVSAQESVLYMVLKRAHHQKWLSSPSVQVQYTKSATTSTLPSLQLEVTQKVMANQFTKVIFDSLSIFTKTQNPKQVVDFFHSLAIVLNNKQTTMVLLFDKKDLSSRLYKAFGPLGTSEQKGESNEFLHQLQVSKMKQELYALVTKLFGTQTSDELMKQLRGNDPKTLIDQWEQTIARIIGPQNAHIQLQEIKNKYQL